MDVGIFFPLKSLWTEHKASWKTNNPGVNFENYHFASLLKEETGEGMALTFMTSCSGFGSRRKNAEAHQRHGRHITSLSDAEKYDHNDDVLAENSLEFNSGRSTSLDPKVEINELRTSRFVWLRNSVQRGESRVENRKVCRNRTKEAVAWTKNRWKVVYKDLLCDNVHCWRSIHYFRMNLLLNQHNQRHQWSLNIRKYLYRQKVDRMIIV